jgi:hypothetical protein
MPPKETLAWRTFLSNTEGVMAVIFPGIAKHIVTAF